MKGYTIPSLGDLTVVEDPDPGTPPPLVRVKAVLSGAQLYINRNMLRRILPAEPKDHGAVVRAGNQVFLRMIDGMVPAQLAWACVGTKELFSWEGVCEVDEPVRMVDLVDMS